MPMPSMVDRVVVSNIHDEVIHPNAIKAFVAEFISTLIFVFVEQGSGMAFTMLTGGAPTSPAGLVAASLAHGFGLFVAVSVGANISGGHVNPAVTFGAFVGGNITLLLGICYIIAQLLGSVVACLLLFFSTGGLVSSSSLHATPIETESLTESTSSTHLTSRTSSSIGEFSSTRNTSTKTIPITYKSKPN
ncbi:hypothetical protein L6452_15965 [Arctium lappa]|uniref:Uncharacterized protein n=1 Tax=Arctium lappa TaxID=4217 RepID=A0ACB9CQ19_ARCLA|nr:hypothetical protein L6452_15965 [Arctium lappa]